MKTRVILPSLALTVFLIMSPVALAQVGVGPTPQTGENSSVGTGPVPQAPQKDPGGGTKLLNPLGGEGGSTSLMQFIQRLLQFIIRIGTIVVVLMLVYTGFLFVKARGNPGEISTAKNSLLWTLIGGLILLGSQAIAKAIEATVQAISL